ncbi:helix-turn-helix domain-containing protein [Nitratireductor sp. OM-1]|uniref:helix-turn-helix domain-containing protein n=1 Tax=Nitratireductor sp. OM-1 TaxID=1756988 RepID=UPI001FE0EECF|nr:AraC family transcriptional regulator [Nitratireductor sp. OM-1]
MISPDSLPQWMAGSLVLDSIPLGWSGIKFRRYRTPPQEISAPALTDFSVVVYLNRGVINRRRQDGPWQTEAVGPGSVSVVTRSDVSDWRWDGAIEASHIYLPFEALAGTAQDVFDRDIEDIELKNFLAIDDSILTEAAFRLAEETRAKSLGGCLYVEALRCQISVHILRSYATVSFRQQDRNDGLSRAQRRLLIDYIEENIGNSISLADLAALLGLSVFHFSRRFRAEFGRPPYAYVLQRRLEHAKRQLSRKDVSLKTIAAASGFSDQSHMTRLFKRELNISPAQYRRQSTQI